MADDKKSGVSRRDLLKRAGMAGAAMTMPLPAASEAPHDGVPNDKVAGDAAQAATRREPIENLTASEADLLEVICSRIIPSDENGPGAREARAAHYIDRALGGALAASKPAYSAGFAALDRYARSSRGKPFLELSERDMDSVLIDVETGAATGFTGSPAAFFAMVRTHTLQGTFGDPYYGGNANFVGWDLLGYPGVRTTVSADDQRLGAKLTPNHQSAYDTAMFTKAVARGPESGPPKGGRHIDDGHHIDAGGHHMEDPAEGPAKAGHYREAKRHGH
ncbi:MAG: gluconate 2-dehydrogenase subunit 3 family protein [Acidobacteriota bacterium]|nr:gluconate 2-dehydrogenase subunit 3 family protein [Acidobacteriota bacterium]